MLILYWLASAYKKDLVPMTRFLSAGQMMKQAQRTNGQNGREHRKKNEENELGWNRKWTKTAFKSKKKR